MEHEKSVGQNCTLVALIQEANARTNLFDEINEGLERLETQLNKVSFLLSVQNEDEDES